MVKTITRIVAEDHFGDTLFCGRQRFAGPAFAGGATNL
jgi:hypothetical protein